MKVFFERREEIAPGIWTYWFRPERPVDFVPGQYVDLRLVGVQNDPRGVSRTFSITSLPSDTELSFILKHFQLQSPYKQVLQHLQPGDEASIGDAMGDLILPKDPSVPLVYIAGGIGMASYAGMLKELLQKKEVRNIFLFYQVRAAREQICRELSDAYPLQLKSLIIEPNHVTAKEIKATTPPNSLIYISGSQKFVERLRTEFEALGTPRSQIVFDYYDGYTEL